MPACDGMPGCIVKHLHGQLDTQIDTLQKKIQNIYCIDFDFDFVIYDN